LFGKGVMGSISMGKILIGELKGEKRKNGVRGSQKGGGKLRN